MTKPTNPLSDAQHAALRELDAAGDDGLPYGAGNGKVHFSTATSLSELGLVEIQAGNTTPGQPRMVTLTGLGRKYLADDPDVHRQVADALDGGSTNATSDEGEEQEAASVTRIGGASDGSHRTTAGAGKRTVLGEYKGHDILGATVSIRNTGHGLEEAMSVDPVELELGETVYVVLECEVEKHRYDPIKDTNGLQLVNMLKAGRATMIDRSSVERALDEQQARIDEAKGEPQLPFPDESDGDGRPLVARIHKPADGEDGPWRVVFSDDREVEFATEGQARDEVASWYGDDLEYLDVQDGVIDVVADQDDLLAEAGAGDDE